MHAVYWNLAFMCTKKDVLSAVMRELRKYRKLWIQHYFNFQRTFVHDCRSWVIILYRTVSFKISSYSRPYVRIMHESTKAQISLRPSLGKETFNLKNRSIATTSKRAKSIRRDSSLLLSLSSFFFRDFIIIIIVIILLLLFSFGLTVKSEMVNAFG